MTQAEFDYYAARSGLPASAKLAEHQRAFWEATIGAPMPNDNLGELERRYLIVVGPAAVQDRYPNLNDMRFAYFSAVSGLASGSLSDHMQAFFADPGPTELRRNFATNPNGLGAAGWGNANFTRTTETVSPAVPGLSFQRYTAAAAMSGANQTIELIPSGLNAWPVAENTGYIISTYGRLNAGSATDHGIMSWQFYDAAGALLNAPSASGAGAATVGVWSRDAQVVTTPAGTAFLRASWRWISLTMALGETFDLSACLTEEGNVLDSYFDGNFPSCEWVGAADASASILLG